MAQTAIQWATKVWNPTLGCARVSDGCQSCYAEKFAARLAHMGQLDYEGLTTRHQDKSVNWTGVVKMLPERLEEPLHWRKPARIFVDSMSDLFHEAVSDDFLDHVFAVAALASRHTFMILTKRPERMRSYMSDPGRPKAIGKFMSMGTILTSPGIDVDGSTMALWNREGVPWPLPNVWLGVSTENQETADQRIPPLLQTPAAVRFLSCEPLLGPINLDSLKYQQGLYGWLSAFNTTAWPEMGRVHWVIAGGLSAGPRDQFLVRRDEAKHWVLKPKAERWLREIRDDCLRAKVPFFLKQLGGPTNHVGGRQLDGVEWNQFPDGKGGIAA